MDQEVTGIVDSDEVWRQPEFMQAQTRRGDAFPDELVGAVGSWEHAECGGVLFCKLHRL